MPLGTSWRAKRLTVDDDGVTGVVAALVADDQVHLLGDEVGELALALVAPLGADDDGRRHPAMVLNSGTVRRRATFRDHFPTREPATMTGR